MQEMLLNEQKIKKVKKQFEKQKNEEFQGIDIVINNAGVAQSTPFEKITLQEFDKIMAINLRAPFMLNQRALPYLRKSTSSRFWFKKQLGEKNL